MIRVCAIGRTNIVLFIHRKPSQARTLSLTFQHLASVPDVLAVKCSANGNTVCLIGDCPQRFASQYEPKV